MPPNFPNSPWSDGFSDGFGPTSPPPPIIPVIGGAINGVRPAVTFVRPSYRKHGL